MKRLIALTCLLASSCFASVYMPTGGDGATYQVDKFGAPISPKKSEKVIRPDPVKSTTIKTMVHSPKEIVPDNWPVR